MQYCPTVVAIVPTLVRSCATNLRCVSPPRARVLDVGGEPYVVISADCHGGGNIGDYRPYLESRFHDDFDAWAASYQNPFDDVAGDDGSRNWDSARRLRELESD